MQFANRDREDAGAAPRRRRVTGPGEGQRLGYLVRGVLACAAVLLVSACSQGSTLPQSMSSSASAGTAGASQDPLPRFSDWRAAYLGRDGRLHAVTVDGRSDLAGPELPGLTMRGLGFPSAGVAPNGHMLAYEGVPWLTMLDVGAHPTATHVVNLAGMTEMSWSPDSSQLAATDGEGTVYVVSAGGGRPVPIPQQPLPSPILAINTLLGWLDNSHLAVRVVPSGPVYTAPDGSTYVTAVGLGALDVHSGDLRVIAMISFPGLANATFSLSLDGKRALFYNERFRDNLFRPDVEIIDTASGQIRRLPGITQATHAGFSSLAWQQGTDRIAASTGFQVNGDLQSWLLDAQSGTASPLLNGQYVAGWAPDNGPLVLSSSNAFEIGAGPNVISSVTMRADGQIAATALTRSAWSFPFIGFVRTG